MSKGIGWVKQIDITQLHGCVFNNMVKKVKTVSYHNTIDVKFGIKKGINQGFLVINLKPSKQAIDWLLNFMIRPLRVDSLFPGNKGLTYHRGYVAEWMCFKDKFINDIKEDPQLSEAIKKGMYVVGKSKGGGEAPLVLAYLLDNYPDLPYSERPTGFAFLGGFEAPRVCNKAFKAFIEKKVGKSCIYWFQYHNDIVPSLPWFSKYPGIKIQIGKRGLGLSIKKDHEAGCREWDLTEKLTELKN